MKRIHTVLSVAVAGCLVILAPAKPVWACPDKYLAAPGASGENQQHQAISSLDVKYDAQRDMVRVSAQGQTVDQILVAIAKTTAVRIGVTRYQDDCGQVNVSFDYLPLEAAVARVLKGSNYVISDESGQGIIGVWILPAGNDAPLTTATIKTQEFFRQFQGQSETERFAEELQRVEGELSAMLPNSVSRK
jgi:hypothetical protein